MAPRRRTIVLVTASAMLLLLVIGVSTVVALTQTDLGRAMILRAVLPAARAAIPGQLHVGRIGGTLFTDITVDSIDLRTPDGTPFLSVGRVRATYDPRDLLNFRVIIRSLEIDRPHLTLVDYGNDDWNWKRALRKRLSRPSGTLGQLGRYIVIDTTTLNELNFVLKLPWELSDTLRGAKRDSALTHNLTRRDSDILHEDGRYVRVYRFVRGQVSLGRTRLADPDSVGQHFPVRRLDVVWDYPPFWFRKSAADVHILADTMWVDGAHLSLPGSEAHGTARVVWGSALPVRYDIALRLDTVSMIDLAWIDKAMPHSGSGRANLTIRNDSRDLSIIEYGITDMDARSLHSRIRGDMTWGVGGPVVRLTGVRLNLQPAHTDLLRWMNGEPFPYDWRGALTGSVLAKGGYVTDWRLDEARLAFADEHVPGAISRATATGVLNIYTPAEAILRGLDLSIDTLDFRTPRFVNPLFAELDGFARGRVRLDSLWYDAEFSDADIELVDGPGQPSRFTGRGRFSLIPEGTWFDVDMQAVPLSYTTLSRSYPSFPLRGAAVGSIAARGMADRFDLQTTLAGEGGELAFTGRVDALEPQMGAFGTWRMRGANLQSLLGDSRWPESTLSMAGTVNIEGELLSTLRGPLTATVDQFSRVAQARLFGGTVSARFDSGHVYVDTLAVESSALRLAARGGLGLERSRRDSVHFVAYIDSLGGLRPWLTPTGSDSARALLLSTDTLRGTVELRGSISGSVDSLDARGLDIDVHADLAELVLAAIHVRKAALDLRVDDVTRAANGALSVIVDSSHTVGIEVAEAVGHSTLRGGLADRFSLAMRTPSESRLMIAGGVTRNGDSTSITFDTLTIRVDSGFARPRGFTLAAPARLHLLPAGVGVLDSLVLQHTDTGRFALRGAMGRGEVVEGVIDANRVPLGDFGRLTRTRALSGGTTDLRLELAGTRTHPRFDGTVSFREAVVGRMRLGDLQARAHYDSLRLVVAGALRVDGVPALQATATLPLDLALAPVRQRRLDEQITGSIFSERADLNLIESLFPDVTLAAGTLETDVRFAGTWTRPRLRGQLRVNDAALTLTSLGIRLERATADIELSGDSVLVHRLGARGGPGRDSLGISGTIGITEIAHPTFDLRLTANDFLVIDKPRVATLTISTPTPITLTGDTDAPLVRGGVRIDRGRIYISELAQRRTLDLGESFDLIDTTRTVVRGLLPSAPGTAMQNLRLEDVRVGVGDDVWLRSPEANLKLGGQLRLTSSVSADRRRTRLALADSLTVERGTYQLNLGIARPGFEVERGMVRFFGDPDLEPSLDITALHVVRETRPNSNRQDVRIRVNIGGTIDQPTLSLASADNPPLPESDMLSYLVTGEPAYALLGTPYAEQGATLALRLAGSYLSSRLAGGRFDVVQIEPTALNPGDVENLRESGLGILATTRVGVGGQVARNTYLTFSTGLCGLAPQTGSGDALSLFAQGLGVKVERRFSQGLSVALGLEPGSSAQACGRLGISRTFQQTPPQIGIDFFRYWTFN